jgi:uncharacterized damage-inducible protein DinB
MTAAAHYRMFAHYNAWANQRLFDVAARLTSEQYRADRGAFFKSVHGTLNHLLVTDRIWMQRFTGEGKAPDRLDAILFETFDELRAAREAEDRRIVDFVDRLDDNRIAGTIKYRRVSTPELFEQQLAPALAHWFNHQTHHRGQIHALLTGLVGAAPRNSTCCIFSGYRGNPPPELTETSLSGAKVAAGDYRPASANAAKLCIRLS